MGAIRVTRYQEVDPVNVRRARRASGLTARAVSESAGLHDQYVSRLERGLIGEIPSETFDAIAAAMVGSGEFAGRDLTDVLHVMTGRASFRLELADGSSDYTSYFRSIRGLARVA